MHIIIASLNPVKIGATEDAFNRLIPAPSHTFSAVSVPSGVPDQPIGDDETWRGANNRAQAAAEQYPEADYCVGLEGGIDTLHGQVSTFAWIVIRDNNGNCSQSRTTSLPLPKAITDLIDQGIELGHACDQLFSTDNAKQKGGAIGLLTRDIYDRRSTYTQAVVFALAGLNRQNIAHIQHNTSQAPAKKHCTQRTGFPLQTTLIQLLRYIKALLAAPETNATVVSRRGCCEWSIASNSSHILALSL